MADVEALEVVQAHLRLAEAAAIDKQIGTCWATIASAMSWWAQFPPSDETFAGAHAGWVERFGAAEVRNTLELLIASAIAGRRFAYGANARAPQ